MELDPHPLTFWANEPLADVRERFEAMRVDLNWKHLHKSPFWDVVRGLETDSLVGPLLRPRYPFASRRGTSDRWRTAIG